ncbi:MAG: tRNA uridine-5-carboxymethylaminomethyl(34) synthesis GTPase MnmE, partial [Turicibacter sp.]
MLNDTIVAISTAMGEGAISIIRLSGDDAFSIANKIFKGKNLTTVDSHTINYGHIYDAETDTKIDEVLVSVMKAPRTFTAENVVEINCHGGILVTNKILELLLTVGARLAEPGEFTKRAFLNGRIDLAQAESIMDIIHAKSQESLSLALNGLDGRVSKLIKNLREEILNIVAQIEVNIDYPEYEDVEEMTSDVLLPKALDIKVKMEQLLDTAKTGKILRDGIKTAIIGRPNVGKSSLLNQLMREEKAIVTNIAGTTRDTVEGFVNVGGITLNLIDTAGIRETEDIVESIGVEKAKKLIDEAELVLLVLNSNEELTENDRELLTLTESKNRLVILNKSDLENKIEREQLPTYIETSMVKEKGIEILENQIKKMFEIGEIKQHDLTYLSNARHIAKLKQAIYSINDSINAMNDGMLIDMIEIDVKNAWYYLGEILGEEIGD